MGLSVLDAVTDVLPPTKTYGRRSLCWIPVDPYRPVSDGRLGNLSIKLEHAKSGVRRAVECDTYAVEKDSAEPGDNGGDAFWLVNLTDKEQERPYRCVVGGLNALPRCDCKAGQCRVPGDPEEGFYGCKHRCALIYLIENGLIGQPRIYFDPDIGEVLLDCVA